MAGGDYIPQKDGDCIGTTTKTSFDTNHSYPSGTTYFRVKAQRGEEVSEAGNVVVV